MQYRKDQKGGNSLSILGFGCMRLPNSMQKTEELLLRAYEAGVNYFDMAYLYFGSEKAVGSILQKHSLREKVFLATKLPHMMCKTREDFDKFLNEQKSRLQTDYIDYYLIHNVSEYSQWENLRKLGIEEWVAGKKQAGEIRRIGFSFHGSQHDFFSMLDAYDWDFVQIQYNYINTHYQAGVKGLKRAAERGLPVIIMEPLLGGKLANGLPEGAKRAFQEAEPGSTPVSWGLRWLWNQPEVTVVLSGMNEMRQLEENLALADTSAPGMFGKAEEQVIRRAVEAFSASYRVRCTGCDYCMPCPKNINIPALFSAYNTSYSIGWFTGVYHYMNASGMLSDNSHFASSCVQCGKCESRCPQGIEIRNELKAVKRRLEIPGIKPAARLAKGILRR